MLIRSLTLTGFESRFASLVAVRRVRHARGAVLSRQCTERVLLPNTSKELNMLQRSPSTRKVEATPLALDPEIAAALQKMTGDAPPPKPPPPGEVAGRRAMFERWMGGVSSMLPKVTDVTTHDFVTKSADGTPVKLRWYEKEGGAKGPAVLYLHGGGMILGSVDIYDTVVRNYVSQSGVPMLSVDYRLAPESPHPKPVEDCYAGLTYLADHAASLGVDPKRIGVMGESAGGGLATAIAMLARDRNALAPAKQILIYAMLDDRNTKTDPRLAPFAAWTYDDNVTGWRGLLGARFGTDDVPPIAAPARATDVNGLPPAYIEVGQLDIFCNEDIAYALELSRAGVPVELHVRPGAQHGFELIAPASKVAERSTKDRLRVLQEL
jgi:acetyl esterase/lipase